MDICRYYRQGNCRYGQYCRYEHTNSFGRNAKINYNEDELITTVVVEEVQNAERGGQWLLSCFSPFSCGPCIPGMEDLSPEEVRWEMYQAQKNGMVQQAKLRFQQLCQDMKSKRDALKTPNRETIAILKKLEASSSQGLSSASAAGKSSNFSFATPQLGNPSNTSSSNVFGNKTFGSQSNPFGGSFSTSNSNSIFGRSTTNTNSVFGGTPAFGNNLGTFNSTANTNSVFGGSTNTQPFGSVAAQSNPVFSSSTSQAVFGQPNVFGSSSQTSNVFARPQTSQTATSVFDTGTTSSNSLFSGAMTSQPSTSLFGGTKTSTTNLFSGAATQQTSTSVFGNSSTSGNFNTGIFSQTKTIPAFGGAPVFGNTSSFTSTPNTIFGATTNTSGSGLFGSGSTTTAGFGSVVQSGSTFGTPVASSASNVFGAAQNTNPVISSANTSPFGAVAPTTSSSPFVTATSQFDSTTTTASVFSKPAFAMQQKPGEPFGATPTSSAPFGTANTGSTFRTSTSTNSPFTSSTFGDMKNSTFASTITTTTTTTTNPFAPRTQQINSPIAGFAQTQGNLAGTETVNSNSNSPFAKSPFATNTTTVIVDDTVYTQDGQLTDDEKSMYLAKMFTFGKIPLKPPTKEMR